MRIVLLAFLGCLAACAAHSPSDGTAGAHACGSALTAEQELAVSMAEQRAREGQHYAALAALQSLPEQSPLVLRSKADVMRRLGRPEAESYLLRLQKTCHVAWADHGLGLMAAQRGDIQQARLLLQRAAIALPTEYRLRNDFGVLLLREKDIDGAHFELMTAVELSGKDPLPAVNLLAFFLLQDRKAAIEGLSRRYQMDAGDWAAGRAVCREIEAYWKTAGAGGSIATAACEAPESGVVVIGNRSGGR